MEFPIHVTEIIDRLEASGFEAYAVGGCVRNRLIGLTPPDYDLATSAFPDEIKEVFKDYKTVDIGEKHGTIAVIIKKEKIEITSFRSESGYSDSRHPDSVTFTRDLKTDLSRRDFTVNAMAYSGKSGLVDLYDGEKDLRDGVLRCVGEPEIRFTEDALRIMRALRFMSELGLKCEKETEEALFKLKENLLKIKTERIAPELDKLLLGNHAEEVILKYYEILGAIIPEMLACAGFDQRTRYHIYDVLTHIAKTVTAVPKDRILRLTMFFHDIAKPMCFSMKDGVSHFRGHGEKSAEIAEKTMRRLRYNNALIYKVELLVEHHDLELKTSDVGVKRLLNKYGPVTLRQLCEIQIADDSAKAEFVKDEIINHRSILEKIRRIEENGECFSLPGLAVNGDDLIELGYRGEQIGNTLRRMLESVITGQAENKKEVLLEGLK